MDNLDRETAWELGAKQKTVLSEGWKRIVEGKGAKAVGEQLKKKQDLTEEDKKDTPVDAPVGDAPVADAPVGDTPPVDAPVADAPVGDVPEVTPALQPDPEKQLATQQFVAASLKGLQAGDADIKDLVTEYGFLKAEINDPQNGQFVVVAFPASMKLADVAAVAEPVETPAQIDTAATGGAVEPEGDDAGEAGEAGEEPVGDAPVSDEAPAAEEPKEDEELKEEENDEKKLEEARDPVNVGKKDWKAYVRKIFEAKTPKLTPAEEAAAEKEAQHAAKDAQAGHIEKKEKEIKTLENRIKTIKGEIEKEKEPDQKKRLESDLAKANAQLVAAQQALKNMK